MTEEQQLQYEIVQYTDGSIQADDDIAGFRQRLADYINALISTDFSKLVFILYRLDISEKKLKQILAGETKTDAGLLIAGMIIERQLQKIQLRKQFAQDGRDIAEEEKW